MITLNAGQVKPAPEFGASLDTQYIIGLGTVEDRMLILVDIEKLMTDGEMALMESAAVAA